MSDAGTALGYIGLGTGRAATAIIVARHNAGDVAKASYAAGVADAYTTATPSDWFLPSRDELNEVCKYAHNTGQAAGASAACSGGTLRRGWCVIPKPCTDGDVVGVSVNVWNAKRSFLERGIFIIRGQSG